MPNLRKWSTTATGNASIAGGASTINWAEGQLPSTVNNSMREASAQVRSVYKPSEWGWVEHSATASVASQTTFKIAADVTADYVQGRRVRLTGGSTIMYGDIVSSSFTAQTTITLNKDSGSLSASMSIAAVSVVYDKNDSGANNTYTPTLTNGTNVAASTAFVAQYMRVGNVVHVSGRVDVDATASGTATQLDISLPIASNFNTAQRLGGTAISDDTTTLSAASIKANTVDDRAQMSWIPQNAANISYYFTFTYLII